VTTGIVKCIGVALEDRDIDRGDDGIVAVGEFETFDVDATGESVDSGKDSEELVDVASLLEEATRDSSGGGDGVLNTAGLTRGVAWTLVISFALSQ